MLHYLVATRLLALCAAISCRKPHRESTTGHFVAPLNEKGETVERQGFHVECVTDLDCFSRCGSALRFKHLIHF